MCLLSWFTKGIKIETQQLNGVTAERDNEVPLKSSQPSVLSNFRVLGYVAMAAKRFQASLNPTVSFRKRNLPEDVLDNEYRAKKDRLSRSSSKSFRRTYTRTASGQLVPRSTHEHRGHMTSYLFRPLPPQETKS